MYIKTFSAASNRNGTSVTSQGGKQLHIFRGKRQILKTFYIQCPFASICEEEIVVTKPALCQVSTSCCHFQLPQTFLDHKTLVDASVRNAIAKEPNCTSCEIKREKRHERDELLLLSLLLFCSPHHCELNLSGISKGTAQGDRLAGIRRHFRLHFHPLTRRS